MNGKRRSQLAVVACITLLANILVLPLTYMPDTADAAEQIPAVIVNGQPLELDTPPLVENGRVLVPVRAVCEALGAQMQWDGDAQMITATRGADVVRFWLNQVQAERNGSAIIMDVMPRVVNDRVLVPLRFIANALGAEVSWDPAAMQAIITMEDMAEDQAQAPSVKDQAFEQAATYGPQIGSPVQSITGNAIIKAAGVTLQNLVIEGDLIVADEVGAGDVYLNNITVKGRTCIRGGGADSIHIDGGQYSVINIEQTPSGQVRIVAINIQGIPVTVAENAEGQEIILEGDFNVVAVNASGVSITALSGTVINQLSVSPGLTNVYLQLSANSSVGDMILESPVEVAGEGQVESASGTQADDSSFANPPVVIIPTPGPVKYQVSVNPVDGGSATVTVDKSAVEAGEVVTISISGIEPGKDLESLTVSDASGNPVSTATVAAGSTYTFIMPAADTSVSVAITARTVTPIIIEFITTVIFSNVNIAPVDGGSAVVTADKSPAQQGDVVTIDISAIEPGKQFSALEVTSASGAAISTNEIIPGSEYTFVMPDNDVTVKLILTAQTINIENILRELPAITVAPVQGGPGTVTVDHSQAAAGQIVTATVTGIPDGWWIKSFNVVAVDGSVISSESPCWMTYTFIMPDKDVTINMSVSPIEIFIIQNLYSVNIMPVQGDTSATVSVDRSCAAAGDLVTVTVANIPEYREVSSLRVEDTTLAYVRPGETQPSYLEVPVTETTPFQIVLINQGETNAPAHLSTRTYQFTMPAAPVNIRLSLYATQRNLSFEMTQKYGSSPATASISKTAAAPGELVTITVVVPFEPNYVIATVNGGIVPVVYKGRNGNSWTWTFFMPDADAHVKVHVQGFPSHRI